MELSGLVEDDAPGRTDDAYLRIGLKGLFGSGLLPGITHNVLRRILAAISVPLVVIEAAGAVTHSLTPVSREERHGALRFEIGYGKPPVQLTERLRVPSIAMRVERVRYPSV